jgi:hypothetical protein
MTKEMTQAERLEAHIVMAGRVSEHISIFLKGLLASGVSSDVIISGANAATVSFAVNAMGSEQAALMCDNTAAQLRRDWPDWGPRLVDYMQPQGRA